MPSTRRTLLKGVPCAIGLLAGCTTSDSPSERESNESISRRHTQTNKTTHEKSQIETTTSGVDRRAITFNHQKRVIDKSVRDVESSYSSQVLRSKNEARRLDVTNVRGSVSEQDVTRIDRFVSAIDFADEVLIVVQTAVPSPRYRIEFDFLNRVEGTTHAVFHLEETNESGSKPAISTSLVRIPTDHADAVEITVVDVGGAYTDDPLRKVTTFSPTNETLVESLNVGPSNKRLNTELGVPGGALLTNADLASKFVPDDSSYANFLQKTSFDSSYVLAIQATMPNSGYYLFPQTIETDGSEVTIRVRQQNFGGGLNAEFNHLLLARIPSASPPEYGTATVHTHDADETIISTQEIPLRNDPDAWDQT